MSSKRFGVALFGSEPIQNMVSYVQLAEELGFDSVWLVDSQLICREVYVTLSACAVGTSRIKLATGVTVPFTRHPTVVASAFATLDELSRGRMVLGISTGNSSARTLGREPAKVSELEEYVAVLRRLLRNEVVRVEGGTDWKMSWMGAPCSVPVYVAATGPKLTQAGARMADGVILLQGIAPELIAKGVQLVSEGAARAGKVPEQVDIVCWTYLALSDDPLRARDHVRGRVAAVLRILRPDAFEGEDREVITRIHREYDYSEHAAARPRHGDLVPDRMVDQYALAGTPQEVRERLMQLMNLPGFSQIVFSLQVSGGGSMSVKGMLRSFAEDVLGRVA